MSQPIPPTSNAAAQGRTTPSGRNSTGSKNQSVNNNNNLNVNPSTSSSSTSHEAANQLQPPSANNNNHTTTATTTGEGSPKHSSRPSSNNSHAQQQQQQQPPAPASSSSSNTNPSTNAVPLTGPASTTSTTTTTTTTTTQVATGAAVPTTTTTSSTTAAAATATTTATTPPAAASGRVRPVMQLTQNLVQFYHDCNEKVYWRKRMDIPGPKWNDGYDDSIGHYIVYPGEEIIGRYVVLETLGKGSFGTVVRCKDTRRKEIVAAKVTRSGSGFRNQAKLEIDILMRILTQSADAKIVRILKAFDWKGHLVIVFELLSFNLYQLMQCTNYHGVSLDLTSKFAFQLLMVLRDLERINPPVIHCDLKPENVLLVNQNRSAIRVIDFGSACYQNRRMFRYIQSRYYRAPEVIMGLEYGTAIDRWSLGCILMELHTGVALFDGRNEAQQLQRFTGLLGPLPDSMIANSPKRDNFYDSVTNDDGTVTYKLKLAPEPQHNRTITTILERPQRRRQSSSSGGAAGESGNTIGTIASNSQVAGANNSSSSPDSAERYEQFVDLVKKLLEYDPAKRIGVLPAMEHSFLCEFMPYYQQRLASQQQQTQQQPSANSSTNPPASSTTATSNNTAISASTAILPPPPAEGMGGSSTSREEQQ